MGFKGYRGGGREPTIIPRPGGPADGPLGDWECRHERGPSPWEPRAPTLRDVNGPLIVTRGSERWELAPGEVFTFGREASCNVCLDPSDLGISRLAGSLEEESGTWWLINHSATRPLQVVEESGIRGVLAPGRRAAVTGVVTIIVEGQVRRHALALDAGVPQPPGAPISRLADSRPTVTAPEALLSEADKVALVALFAGYLEPFPRYDPHPRSYADAATRLDWPRTTLVKRVEHLRTRLTTVGVPNLLGENALDALAEWALTGRVITRDDLELLPPR
jgi:hypothetical protein